MRPSVFPQDVVFASCRRLPNRRRGFTLTELLVVMFIVLLVSAVALPTVLSALNHRQVSEAARVLQAALVGARDAAIHNNSLSGIRLLPDPGFPVQYISPLNGQIQINPNTILASNRIIPIQPGPNYSEGLINITSPKFDLTNLLILNQDTGPNVPYPGGGVYAYPPGRAGTSGAVLMIEESVYDPLAGPNAIPNPPTSWFWNIRVGDKIQINNSGDFYTVVGPMVIPPWGAKINNVFYGNPEMFVNLGLPGVTPPATYLPTRFFTPPGAAQPVQYQPEYLFLVNGQDDNGNGLIDEGWNGLNDDLVNGTDDHLEWENEVWQGSVETALSRVVGTLPGPPPTPVYGRIQNQHYTIVRRPVPSANARETILPSDVVIDLTTALLTQERSRFPVGTINPFTGYVDIVLTPTGDVVPTNIYSAPASAGMTSAFYHFWLAERGDLYQVQADNNGNAVPLVSGHPFLLPMPLGSNFSSPSNAYDLLVTANPGLPTLRGESRLVSLFTRTGQIITRDSPVFDVNNVSQPFISPQQGVRGGL